MDWFGFKCLWVGALGTRVRLSGGAHTELLNVRTKLTRKDYEPRNKPRDAVPVMPVGVGWAVKVSVFGVECKQVVNQISRDLQY